MEWPLFAVIQLLITTVAVGVAFWLRIRNVQKQNEQLRAQLEVVETEAAGPNFDELIEGLDNEAASTPVVKLVLEHCAKPGEDFEVSLATSITESGLAVGGEELDAAKAQIEELKTQIAEGGQVNEGDELKTLLMQFTNDSREMMACIQNLEAENAEMRAKLGIEADAQLDSDGDANATDAGSDGQAAEPDDSPDANNTEEDAA